VGAGQEGGTRMVYFEPLAQYLADRFNHWVERGRAADASYDQDAACWVMRYGRRHRTQAVFPLPSSVSAAPSPSR
jgi:hypothetical protein